MAAPHTRAITLYWDLNGAAANVASPVSGNWDGATANWNTALSGTGGTPQAGTTSADDLIFSSGSVYTAGTITLSGARVASSISFQDDIDVTLSGGTSLTIGGTGAAAFDGIRVLAGNNSANAISTALVLATGTNTIQNAGTGVLTISGGITGSQNLILQNNSTNAAGITISTASLNNTGTLTNSGTGTGGVLVSAVIGSNVTSVTQNSATSRLTLSNANLFTGAVTISAGALRAANNTALGTTAGGVSVASGAALEIDGSGGDLTIGAEALSLNGTGISSGGALRNIAGNNSYAGAITLADVTGVHRINSDSGTLTIGAGGITETGTNNNKDLTFGGAGNVTVTGNITASGGDMRLFKDGAGTLTLSGAANTYDGLTTISAGTLAYGADNIIATGGVTVNGATAVLDLGASHTDSVGTVTVAGGGSITGTGTSALTSTGTFEMQSGSVGAILAGVGIALNKTTAGTVTLSGANTYTGLTNITAGTLAYGADNVISTGAVTVNGATAVLDLGANQSDTVGTVTVAGGGSITGTGTSTLTSTGTFAMQSGSVSAILAGSVPLNKTTAGTVTLSGANTYTGLTTISAGALRAANNTALGSTASGVTVTAAGAALELDGSSGALAIGAEATTLNGSGISTGGALRNIAGDNSYAGVITLGSSARINSDAGTLTIDSAGSITGPTFTLTVGGAGNVVINDAIATTTGGLTKDGTGTLTLNQANTYTGTTSVSGGVLLLNHATALPGGLDTAVGAGESGLTLTGGGVVGLATGDFTRALGTGAGQVQWTGSGGFAAYNADRTVNLGGAAATVTWNSGSFVPTGSSLVLGAAGADATVTFQNPIALNGAARTVQVADGDATVDAILNGVLSGTGSSGLTKTGNGTLTLSQGNTYNGTTTISAGTVRVQSNTSLGNTTGTTSVASGAAIEIDGSALTVAEVVTSLGGDGGGGGALRNLANNNTWSGAITIADTNTRINSDAGTLTLSGAINETGGSNKTLTFGGAGNITVSNTISESGNDLDLAKDGAGTLTLSAANTYDRTTSINAGTVVLNGANGAIADSSSITIGKGATLQLDNSTNNTNRIGSVTVTMNGGTFDFAHAADGTAYSETAGTLSINSGASTVSTDTSAGGGSSILTFGSLSHTAGATVNFGGGSGNPSAASDDNNIRFTAAPVLVNGIIGTWATVGGTNFATYTGGATPSVEALATFTDVTRLSSGTKAIPDTSTANVRIIEGTGLAADNTLAGVTTTTINTLTQSAVGGSSSAYISPTSGQTLRVGSILVASGAGALSINSGGTVTTNTSGGELILQNYSSNSLSIASVIANNTSASSLTVAGTGSVVVYGTNTYTGQTRITGGTLEVGPGASGALTGTSAVTVNTGGTLLLNGTGGQDQVNNSANFTLDGGTVKMGSGAAINETVGTLTLSSNSIIDFSTLNNTSLNFANSSGVAWIPGMSLNIYNWTKGSDHLFFGSTSAGLTVAQLGQINLYSDNGVSNLGPATITSLGEVVVAVPEPSAILVGLTLLSLAGWRERRWLLRCKAARRNPAAV